MPTFEIDEGSIQEKAWNSRKPIQILAGGYGWGKTALLCVKCIDIMLKYPGCNGAILRNTQKNLEKTTMKEFMKWCPKSMVEKYPTKTDSVLRFKNGSECLFNYIALARRGDSETMNLLGGTLDFVFVDQLEDPEFSLDLFLHLQGRLRGTAQYVGDDDSMPKNCNWFMATTNPTQNWISKYIVRPLKVWEESGTVLPELMKDEEIWKKEGRVVPIVELVEGTTYDNSHVPEEFTKRLANMYKGAMYDKFVLGKWDVSENLVYPMFNYAVHVVDEFKMEDRLKELRGGYKIAWKESLDYGIASPSCYLLGFVDENGIVSLVDGWYEKELNIREQVDKIKEVRKKWGIRENERVIADPALFRRTMVDVTVSDTFAKYGIDLEKGNNNILGGIGRVSDYLNIDRMLRNPYTGLVGSPRLFVSSKLGWFIDEIVDYKWKVGKDGVMDKPVDKNDHAMDSVKYMLTFDDDKVRMLKKQVEFQQEIRRWRPASSM